MVSKRIKMEEGQVYAVPLTANSYTLAQLYNKHLIGNSKQSQVTFAFFNYKFSTLEAIKEHCKTLDLSKPFAIATTNRYPWHYDWSFLCSRTIDFTNDYKTHISHLGLFNNRSTDPLSFLEPSFVVFSWDVTVYVHVYSHLLPDVELTDYFRDR